MNKSPWVLLVVFLSVLAGVLVGAALWRSADAHSTPAAAPGPGANQVQRLAKDLEKLQADVARLDADNHATAGVETRPVPDRSTDPSPEIARRLDALEQQIAALQGRMDQMPSEQELAARKLTEAKRIEVSDVQRVATDRSANEKDRLAALRGLRDTKTADGQDARSHDVIVAMLDIAEHSESEDSRLDVYRNLHGADDPAVRDSMLRALTQDSSSKVRKKVAQDIDTYLDDPLVQSGLRRTAESDADLSVRTQAAETLAKKK
jgi:flagellar basal body-associated protein FliL